MIDKIHEAINTFLANRMSQGDVRALAANIVEAIGAVPIDALIFCPRCKGQHVDKPETEEEHRIRLESVGPIPSAERWTNPAHKKHLCHYCGNVFQTALVPTNGVESLGESQ